MAESTLSLTLADFRVALTDMLGYPDYASASAAQQAQIDLYIKEGLLQFYNPSVIDPSLHHEWSFLHPIQYLTTNANYSTGTIAIASGVVTGTDTTFPSWAADGNVIVGEKEYTVDTRDSDTQLTLDDTSVTVAAGASYVLTNHDMDLPDDYGGIEGPLTYPDNKGYPPIQIVGEGEIRRLRSSISDTGGHPTMAAVRPKNTTVTSSAGQRFEIMLWPDPDAEYQLQYQYTVIPDTLVASSTDYPLGGGLHSATIMSSILAVGESKMWHAPQLTTQRDLFLTRLQASIKLDRKKGAPPSLGYNGDARWQRTNRWRDPRILGHLRYFGTSVSHANQ